MGIYLIKRVSIEEIRTVVENLDMWGLLALFALRLTSVVISALPGTADSVLAGKLFGFVPALIVICLADLVSFNHSYYLSCRYGRDFIIKLVGKKLIEKCDRFSQRNLEHHLPCNDL